jgi:hypothetical protein
LTESKIRKSDLARLGTLSFAFMLALSALSAVVVHAAPAYAASPSNFAFTNYELGRSNYIPFPSPPDTCPNGGPDCWNWNAEPNIASAPDGSIYASSENAAFDHLNNPNEGCNVVGQNAYTCGGTGAWKSTDYGAHFTSLTSPNTQYVNGSSYTLWGGDTQIAVAPQKNANGFYNVYVVSLEAAGSGLIGVGESTSQDGGATWTNNPLAVQFTNPISAPGVQDRPWVAAYGSNEVCIESHTGAVVPGIFCSFDAGLTFTRTSTGFDAAHSWLTAETSIPGAIRIDPNSGIMYLPFSGLASAAEATDPVEAACGSTTGIACPYGLHAVYVAVSTDGGLTFTDYPVYVNPNVQVSYGTQFLASAIDQAGNVYEVYSDGVNLFYSFSTDHGQTWSGPYQVNQAPSSWAIEPWIAAGAPGKIDVVWYGSSNCGSGITDVNTCQSSATWNVYFAQNLDALSNPTGFNQVEVTGTIHEGPVCTNGSGCQSYRGLFDDFGITANPITGLATIVYDNDMYTPSNADNLPNPDCTAQYTGPTDPNQQLCVHTDIAHQTKGPGLFTKHTLAIEKQSLTQDGNPTLVDYALTAQNTGDAAISSLSVSIAGVPAPLTLNSALPLQPGSTTSGTSAVSSLPFVLGDAYPVVVTAIFNDGVSVTNSTSVLYTLP